MQPQKQAQLGYQLGRICTAVVALALAAVLVLLAAALVINAARTALWLTTDHPIIATALAAVGVILVGRKL